MTCGYRGQKMRAGHSSQEAPHRRGDTALPSESPQSERGTSFGPCRGPCPSHHRYFCGVPLNSCKQNWEIPETATRLITLVYCPSLGDSAVGKSLLSEPGMKSERESDERGCYWHGSCSGLPPPCQGPALSPSPAATEAANGANWGRGGRRTSSPWGLGLGPKSRQGPVHSSGSLGGSEGDHSLPRASDFCPFRQTPSPLSWNSLPFPPGGHILLSFSLIWPLRAATTPSVWAPLLSPD